MLPARHRPSLGLLRRRDAQRLRQRLEVVWLVFFCQRHGDLRRHLELLKQLLILHDLLEYFFPPRKVHHFQHRDHLVAHLRVEDAHAEELHRQVVLRLPRERCLLGSTHLDIKNRQAVSQAYSECVTLRLCLDTFVRVTDKVFYSTLPQHPEGARNVIKLPDPLDDHVDDAGIRAVGPLGGCLGRSPGALLHGRDAGSGGHPARAAVLHILVACREFHFIQF